MRHETIQSDQARTVSATDFVRNFAQHKRLAEGAPVYIEAHGKPGWALVSTAVLDAMTRGGVADAGLRDASARLDIILDAVCTRVVLLDDALLIQRVNAAFRCHARLGDHAVIGRPLSALLNSPVLETVREAAQRVVDSGTTELFELDSVMNPGRVMAVTIARMPEGVAILGEDVTAPAELAGMRADMTALRNAAGASPGLCLGRVNPRGSIDSADANLSQLSGIANDSLLGARLGSLFDMSSRARVNELVDQVLDGGQPGWTRARMLARGADAVPAALGLAAIRGRQGPVGAAFIIQDKTALRDDA